MKPIISKNQNPIYFYRYEEVRYSRGVDQYDNPLPGCNLKVHLREYKIISITPKGVWIQLWGLWSDEKKFILLSARKRFACPTKKEAVESFKARKNRQIQILNGQLKQAKEALSIIEKQGLRHETP